MEVRNVYNGVQIKIIVLQNELGIEQKNVPEFEEIFDEEEEEVEEVEDEEEATEGGEEEEDEGNGDEEIESNENLYSDDEETSSKKSKKTEKSKRKRFDPDFLEKRHKKREWEEKRLVVFKNF